MYKPSQPMNIIIENIGLFSRTEISFIKLQSQNLNENIYYRPWSRTAVLQLRVIHYFKFSVFIIKKEHCFITNSPKPKLNVLVFCNSSKSIF